MKETTSMTNNNSDSMTVYTIAIILGVILYWPILSTGMLSDDWGVAFADRPFASLHGHWFGGGHGQFYRPLSRISIYLQGLIFGGGGLIPHVISLALFFSTALLVGKTISRWGYPLAGAVSALLFIIHPGNVETVSWISSQTDLNVCFFFALCAYLLSPPITMKRIYYSFGAAILCYASKDNSILLAPIILMAVVAYGLSNGIKCLNNRKMIMLTVGHSILFVIYLGLRKIFMGRISPEDTPVPGLERVFPSFNLANLTTAYKELLSPILPWFDSSEKYYLLAHGGPSWWFWISFVLLVGWLWFKGERILSFLIILLIVFCIPIIMAPHPYFLESLKTSRRYLVAPLLVFPSIIAIALLQKKDTIKPGIAILLFLIVQAWGLESSRNISDWVIAGKLRDKIKLELDNIVNSSALPIQLYPMNVPHRFYNAFVFQNGLEDFIKYYYDNKIILMPPSAPGAIPPQSETSYRLDYKGLESPIITR